jgi:LCP family protein required for cell wall assembly
LISKGAGQTNPALFVFYDVFPTRIRRFADDADFASILNLKFASIIICESVMLRQIIVILLILMLPLFVTAQEISNPDDIPDPMPLLDEGDYDIVNFLLIGADTSNPNNVGRTDVLLIVSVNKTAGTVSMLSLPRDLYVYIPGDRVYRINTAYSVGENNGFEGGGPRTVMNTIRYNLGLEIDYYARVDFNDFRQIIDDLGGIEIAVDCGLEDWRLISPDLDPDIEESWEMFTLPMGVHTMDGDLALWYARSRRTTSDFDRGRRHQALMRAIWRRISALSLVDQITDIYPQVLEMVDTDIPLEEMLSLSSMAESLDATRIASYTFRPNIEVTSWTSPEGSSVLVPVREAVIALEQRFLQPPTEHQLVREQPSVEIVNASGIYGIDRVAAERLAWEGFVPQIGEPSAYQTYSTVTDFTGQTKGSSLQTLQLALNISADATIIEPNADRTVDFQVIVGENFRPCTYNAMSSASA